MRSSSVLFRLSLVVVLPESDFVVLGAICGVIAFYFVPGVIETENVLVAIVIGAASGLSATGTNQAVKQLSKKEDS